MKRCSTLLVIKIIQIQIMRYSYTPTMMAIIKKTMYMPKRIENIRPHKINDSSIIHYGQRVGQNRYPSNVTG